MHSNSQANFERAQGAQSKAQQQRVPRFLPNPEECWGPKPRARRRVPGLGNSFAEEKGVGVGEEQDGSAQEPVPIVPGMDLEADAPESKKARV